MDNGNSEQLTFNFETSEAASSDVQNQIPYIDYELLNSNGFSFPQKRFFMSSIVVHCLLVVGISGFVVNQVIEQKKELIEFEIAGESSPPAASVPQSAVPQSAILANPTAEPVGEIVSQPKTIVAKVPAKQTKASPKPQKISSAVKTATTKAQTTKNSSQFSVEPLATISDIAIPELTDIKDSPTKTLNVAEIENALNPEDPEFSQALLAESSNLNSETDDSITDLDTQASAMSEEINPIAERAQSRLQELSGTREALKAMQAKAARSGGLGQSANSSEGTAPVSAAGASSSGLGSGEGIVRALEDLKQMPGNPRPNYDTDERMKGLSGTIIIHAFVTPEGKLTLFRLIQSTGHRSLDRKTLSSLKNWKFYPGQEGWVELPFRWDIKGGVQQKPTLLKRVRSN